MKQKLLIALLYFSPLLWTCLFKQGGAGGEVCAQKHQEVSLLLQLKKHPAQDLQHLKALNALSAAQYWMINADAIATADKAIALAQKLNNQEQLAAAYNNKAFSLMVINLDETENLVQKAIAINKTLNNQTELAKNYTNMASVYYNKGEIEKGIPFRQAALKLADQIKDPLIKGLIYMNTGSYFRNYSSKDSALFYLHKANKYFEQAGHTDFIAYNMLFIGNTLSLYSENDSSMVYLNRSVALAEQTGSLCNLTNGYGVLGLTYLNMANYPKALAYTLKSLRFVEKTKDKFSEVATLSNTGYIYFQLKRYAEAMEYNKKSLAIALEINNSEAILSAYEEIGNVYMGLQNFNEALITYKKGLEIALAASFEMRVAGMHEHIGDVYQKINQYTLALNSFKKAIAINQKTGNNAQLTRNYISIATTIKNAPAGVLTEAGISPAFRYQMAADYLKQALQLNKESGELEVQRDALNGLSDLYDKQKDFGNALIYYKQYVTVKDSIINTETSQSINNLQIQYDTEKKEQQIVLLNKDKALQNTEMSKQKTTRNAFIGGFILVLLIAGIIFNRYRVKQLTNRQLYINLERLKHTQAKLVENEKLASLGQLTAGIAHEIKNPLNFVNNFSELSKDIIDEIRNAKDENARNEILADLKENIDRIKHHGNRADNIVKSMMLHSRDSAGEKVEADVNQLCEEVLNLSYKNVTLKFPLFSCNVEKLFAADLPTILCDREEISRVVLNLLDNAFYAVRARGTEQETKGEYKSIVTLTTQQRNNSITISIKDNGSGIPEKIKEKIFEPFFTTKPTHEGTGLGLSICNDIIKAHGGEMKVESKENEFTEFVITLLIT